MCPHSLWRSNMVNRANRMWKHTDHRPTLSECVSVYLFHPCWLIYRVRGKSGNHHWVSDLSRQVLGYSLSQGRRVPPLWLTLSLIWSKILHYRNTTCTQTQYYMYAICKYCTTRMLWQSVRQWISDGACGGGVVTLSCHNRKRCHCGCCWILLFTELRTELWKDCAHLLNLQLQNETKEEEEGGEEVEEEKAFQRSSHESKLRESEEQQKLNVCALFTPSIQWIHRSSFNILTLEWNLLFLCCDNCDRKCPTTFRLLFLIICFYRGMFDVSGKLLFNALNCI